MCRGRLSDSADRRCGKIRVLAALGFPIDPYLDVLVTGLVLVGGSDRVAEMRKLGSGEAKSEPEPIAIKGEITLANGDGNMAPKPGFVARV